MNESSDLLGGAVWRRGAVLGLQWATVLFVVTLGIYFLMGVTGWSGTLRALCAMGVGPVLGVGVIAAWWMVRRPAFVSPDAASEPDESEDQE